MSRSTRRVNSGRRAVSRAPRPERLDVARQGGYLAKRCFVAAAKDNMPLTYPIELKASYSPFAINLMDDGSMFENHIGARLRGEADSAAVVVIDEDRQHGERTEEGMRAREQDTWDAYVDPAVRFIYNARFSSHFESCVSAYLGRTVTDVHRVSEPDAIELGPMMANGLRAMRFVDVKWHKTTAGSSAPKAYLISPLAAPFFHGELDSEKLDLAGELKIDDWMQLAHYYRHAESLELVDDEHSLWGSVIGREEILVWDRLDRTMFLYETSMASRKSHQSPLAIYDREFAEGLAVVANARARDMNPSVVLLVSPESKPDCKECPWRTVCAEELAAHGDSGHITLLPGISPAKAQPYYAAGVNDIGGLARLSTSARVTGAKHVAAAVQQARATMSGRVHRASGIDFVDIPRADVEVDFDCENAATVYMWGVRVTSCTTSEDVQRAAQISHAWTFSDYSGTPQGKTSAFVTTLDMQVTNRMTTDPVQRGDKVSRAWTCDDYTGTPQGEMNAFVSTWSAFEHLRLQARAQQKSIIFYHYSPYERIKMVKLSETYADQPGVPTVDQVRAFFSSDLVVNAT